jgi:prevent-host-death family protein
MEREFSVSKAREQFSDLVEQVQFQGNTFIIRRHGKPAAAIVPIEVLESWRRERQAFFDLIRHAQRQANLTPEAAEQLASEAIAAVRNQDETQT